VNWTGGLVLGASSPVSRSTFLISKSDANHTFDPALTPARERNQKPGHSLSWIEMVSPADIMVGATTDQQAQASRVSLVAGPDPEIPRHSDVVSEWTSGSSLLIEVSASVGRASAYLAAVGEAVLGDLAFDDESAEGIREGRERR
jgi:hypothetical protein